MTTPVSWQRRLEATGESAEDFGFARIRQLNVQNNENGNIIS